MLGAPSSGSPQQRVEQAHHAADRIVGEMRIGDVALPALDDDRARSASRAGRS